MASLQRWTRDQNLAVLYLKIEYQGQLTPSHPAIGMLASAMNRTEASIEMRKANFDALVLSQPWNQKGKGGEVWSGRPGC